jgi:hypothetical protein
VKKGRGRPRPSLSASDFKTDSGAADNSIMSTTISPPIRIAAILGVTVAAALGIGLFLLGRTVDPATLPPPPAHVTRHVSVKPAHARATHRTKTAATHQTKTPATHRTKPRARHFATPVSGFPSAVDRAFRTHRVVVLVVFIPGASVDAAVRKEARAAAIATHSGFVQVSALNNALATEVLAKTGVLPAPAVVVVRRPGRVVATLGVTDRETVMQVVAQARH